MFNRYDGRGHLHDLSEYDSGSWNTSYQLSEEEERIEALCDEERYLALHSDLLEEEARQEEEYKRLSECLADEGSYNAVAFKYTADYYDPSQPTEEEEAAKEQVEEVEPEVNEEPFVAPPGLSVPADVELPATVKTHNIIERTANFVCQQGAQFEIVLKAKQAGNSQFDFLRFDHYLNPYYRHLLAALKEGRYQLASGAPQQLQQDSQSDDSEDDGDGNYLHPSLFAPQKSSRLEELVRPLKVMDPDHPLAVLVQKAKQERTGAAAAAPPPEGALDPAAASAPTQQAADANAAAVFYGYYMLPDGAYCLAPPPPGVDSTSFYNGMASGLSAAPPSSGVGSDPAPTTTPPQPSSVAPAAADSSHLSTCSAPTVRADASLSCKLEGQVSPPVAAIIPPPPDIQAVIDKLAEYVARNGLRFEASVRAKNDPRFDFLQSWHQFNSYYEFKKNYFLQKEGRCFPEELVDADADLQTDAALKESRLRKASFAPICFAIKVKENDLLPLEKNRVCLDDDSDEDKLVEEQVLEALMGAEGVVQKEAPPPCVPEEKKPSLSVEELEAKQAKLKLEDRLAAAAREKLAQASKESKEKQLQAERKRKAALFLQTLRQPHAGEPEAKRVELDSCAQEDSTCSPSEPSAPQKQPTSTQKQVPHRSRDTTSSSHSSSRGGARDRDRKKKKYKRRSRSRSRSKSKSKSRHSLPSAYRRERRARSQSRSPGRRHRRAPSSERPRADRERERHHQARSRRSRTPSERKPIQTAASCLSPGSSPSRVGSASASPAPSLTVSRGGSLEKDRAVSSSIISSVQTKITQDLMAKVRAMLATSKTFQPQGS